MIRAELVFLIAAGGGIQATFEANAMAVACNGTGSGESVIRVPFLVEALLVERPFVCPGVAMCMFVLVPGQDPSPAF